MDFAANSTILLLIAHHIA